uniref:Uncharacterized protein n=1 Tax=Avena sativa TaxID=4498 RepID=A0ACD5V199_AVESA
MTMTGKTHSATAAAAAAAALMVSLMVSATASSPPMGLSGCVTRCGDMEVPYPFGIGPAANCSLPGFSLTCDDDGDGTRALRLGTLQVMGIDLYNATMTVVHSGDINISAAGSDASGGYGALFDSGGLGDDDGPYRLGRENELTVLSCNTAATLTNGNATMSGCFTLCDARYGSAGYPLSSGCNGVGCCRAPIVTDLEVAEGKKQPAVYGVQMRWFGVNRSADLQRGPVHVLVAKQGWFDGQFGSDVLFSHPPKLARMAVPVWLEWEVAAAAPGSDDTRDCGAGARGGYTCSCSVGYQGNPYLPDGCKDIDECEHKEEHGCFGQCNNTQGWFQCSCPPGTQGNHEMPGGCVNSSALKSVV